MSKRKYSNTLAVQDDVESGYDTDATDDTIPDDEYKSSGFTEEPSEPRKISAPSTPEPSKSGPEPPTEVMTKKGRRVYTQFEGMRVPFTTNSYRLGQQPLDEYGNPMNENEIYSLSPIKRGRLFEGGVTKSRRRPKKSRRKRVSSRNKTKRRNRVATAPLKHKSWKNKKKIRRE
jgi:hypothetical protein